MLKITEDQMTALGRVVDEAFEERLFAMARGGLDPWVSATSDAALRAHIREGCDAGRGFGIRSYRGLTTFVGLSLLRVELPFWRDPLFADWLRRRPHPEQAMEEAFEEVAALVDRGLS